MKDWIAETCPYCDKEIIVHWDIEKDGYMVVCPNCGREIMLCSMCYDDNVECDWYDKQGCFRRRANKLHIDSFLEYLKDNKIKYNKHYDDIQIKNTIYQFGKDNLLFSIVDLK